MTEPKLTELLQGAADRTPVSPAPTQEMLANAARTRRRRTILLAGVATAALVTAVGSATTIFAPDETRDRTGPASSPSVSPKSPESPVVDGEAAVWELSPTQGLTPSSDRFTALVSRLACNSGVTGEVLAPDVRLTPGEVIVTFEVEPREPGGADCQGTDQVPYDVTLPEAIGDRALVDGQCLPDQPAETTSFCDPDATRWQPAAPAMILECRSGQRSQGVLDVIPPRSTAEARAQGWPRTARDAARATMEAPLFSASLAELRLGDGERVQRPGGGTTRVQFALTDGTGRTVATITVEELVAEAWATTQLERCA